jgi:hypothetical protein
MGRRVNCRALLGRILWILVIDAKCNVLECTIGTAAKHTLDIGKPSMPLYTQFSANCAFVEAFNIGRLLTTYGHGAACHVVDDPKRAANRTLIEMVNRQPVTGESVEACDEVVEIVRRNVKVRWPGLAVARLHKRSNDQDLIADYSTPASAANQ